ncbi:MAG TPA: ABC transporter permease [Candidatus Cybelea sp.]|nr:ABC transporter permease [Candidatus Cybelea sp.]
MNFPRFASLLRNLLHREREEHELDEEVCTHEQLLVDENMRAGMNPQEARRQARLELGGVEQVKEHVREVRAGHLLETLCCDAHYAARMMWRSPVFTITAVVTLALGIGANTAVFSVVNAVLLRPLPYPDSDRLVQIWSTNPKADRWGMWTAYPRFEDWRRESTVFEEMATARTWVISIKGGDHPESLFGVITSSQLLQVLRVQPMLGRGFLPDEDQPGHDHVIILSYGLWQRRFGSDRAVVGRTVDVDQQNYTVIGVMPSDFRFPPELPASRVDAWLPPAPDPSRSDRGSNNYYTFARLKPGVTVAQAQAEMDAINHGLAEKYSADSGLGVKVVGWRREVGSEVRPALLILLGAISLVLLIACANVANLLLARGAMRQREAALRQALGAGRARLIRQFLTESMLLAVFGGAIGLLLAYAGVDLFIRLAPDIPRLNETTIDPHVLIFSAVLTLGTALIFGIGPALAGSRTDLQDSLKEAGSRLTIGSTRARARSVLVVAEIALALMLLAGAGLLVRSFVRVQQVDLGFNPKNLLTAFVILPPSKYPEPRHQALFFQEVMDRIASLPGVECAGGADSAPMLTNDTGPVSIEGHPVGPDEVKIQAERPKITPDYFCAMGIRLLRGRTFTWADSEGSLPVAIISESAARQYWPDEDAMGKRVKLEDGSAPVWRQVIGIVRDVRQDSIVEAARPEVYAPLLQVPVPYLALAVRTRGGPAALTAAVRHAVMAVDKDQPLFQIQTMQQVVEDSVAGRRFQMSLLAAFATIALGLAGIGIYGLISYTVNQRTHEIGIRVALGAKRRDVVHLVVRHGMMLAIAGVVLGTVGALLLTRFLSGMLYGVGANDPTTLLSVATLLVGVAALASYIPARRAMRVDPMVALRYE